MTSVIEVIHTLPFDTDLTASLRVCLEHKLNKVLAQ